ncbi:glutamate 5-kinase [Paludifilum halophilum]|uniref:Glutamate 5-kinase n=1 Tax=Paludifilum halophilum TaxID=1642702 RepID=A0A235BCC6_9BACL|nr:glutamate 5-kinase [Paludifilum halophilum]OYD09862.1 glutamate 5-kinase [Paludifilum halophilum]
MDRQTIVVKIGTSSLTDGRGRLDQGWLRHHVRSLIELKRRGARVVLVSSGAIAAGFHELGLSERPRTLAGKQAAAAAGQGALVQYYREQFAAAGEICAQVLLTRSDFDHRRRYLNALNTLNFLLDKGGVPVINENDSVSVEEIRWGDNDTLAALVAGLLQADWLLLVTNTDGLFNEDPRRNPSARSIPHLTRVEDRLIADLNDSKHPLGSGGMRSKLLAAKRAAETGVQVYIGTPKRKSDWMRGSIEGKGSGTYIDRSSGHVSRKVQWITVHSAPGGQVEVDEGAVCALLRKGGSLLPCGVVKVKGRFEEGEIVSVTDSLGRSIGRGVVRYSADFLDRVKGWKSSEVQAVQPGSPEEVIHRDDWVAVTAVEES